MRTGKVLFLMAAFTFLAAAQVDPPGRVGRLSYMIGEVTYRPGDVEDWVPADVNRPLTTGDHLWTDEGARAELHLGTAAVRLNSRTAFEFLNLDDANVQIRLAEGSLFVRLMQLGEQESFEVDTPNLAFSLLRPGDYRIDVNPDSQSTTVTVRGGEGEVTGSNQAFTVRAREQARVSSGGDTLSYNVAGAPPLDEWDDWCFARDRREDQSPSARYVSREMVGYQDLDDHGDWRTVGEYGPVWVPRAMPVGWAPYHFGHWVWVEPWGWTWVDDAPWGFAPFHYGRWAYVGYWAWVPGPVAVRPVYAPALVAWVGGPGFSLSVAVGGGVAGIGWFPLGPREVFVPAYRTSAVYVNRVNVTNTTIVNNINITNYNTTNVNYINRNAPGAVTAVPQNSFGTTRRVRDAAVPVQARALQSAQVMNTAPVTPTRQSVLGNYSPAARVAQPPAAIQNRAVVAKNTPPPAPVPFAQRQQALAANPGRPLDTAQVQQLRSTQPAPERTYIRQARTPGTNNPPGRPAGSTAPGTPAGQNPNSPRYESRPPAQNRTQQPAATQQNQPQTQQNDVPPPRNPGSPTVERPAEQARPAQREVQQPNRQAPPAPKLESQPQTQQNNVPPPHNPGSPTVERPAEQTRPPQREVQQPNRPGGQAPKVEKKEQKKDEKKTEERERKQL